MEIIARALNAFMFFSIRKLTASLCDDVLVHLCRVLPGHGNVLVAPHLAGCMTVLKALVDEGVANKAISCLALEYILVTCVSL